MSGKKLSIIVVVSILIFSGVLLLIKSSGGVKLSEFSGGTETTVGENIVEDRVDEDVMDKEDYVIEDGPTVKLETSSSEWRKDEVSELVISFDGMPEYSPNAITVHLLYDPEYVEVTEVTKGDLWTETNVLERKIDNEKGEVKFSAGQNFNSEVTGSTTLANLKVKVIKARSWPVGTEFKLGSDSAMTSTDIGVGEKLILLQGTPIKIDLKN
jgi:hypothetical protein